MEGNTKINLTNEKLFRIAKLEVKKLNNTFKKATKAEKRVMIAEDVLEQIKLGKFKAKAGVYLRSNKAILKEGESLQDILLVPQVKCEVCAIGSAFASCIRIKNKFTIKEENTSRDCFEEHANEMDDDPMREVLGKYFSERQLEMIEDVFENRLYHFSGEEREKAEVFYNKYEYDDNKRLKAIMRNIIKNKGTFVL